MTATAHAIVGVAIATKFPNPWVALPLALISHFVCDKVPHWDVMTDKGKPMPQLVRELAADYLISYLFVALFILFFKPQVNPILLYASALIAQAPDWLEGPYKLLNKDFLFSKFAYKIQSVSHDLWFDSRLKAPWGIVTQAATVLLFFFWAIWK